MTQGEGVRDLVGSEGDVNGSGSEDEALRPRSVGSEAPPPCGLDMILEFIKNYRHYHPDLNRRDAVVST